MRERNIRLSQEKELLHGGKIDDNGKAGVNQKKIILPKKILRKFIIKLID